VFDYTVLGDVVNLASRLEGVNKTYGTRILVNERAAELVKEQMLVREMDLLLVKGKHRPETCFQLIAPTDSPKAAEIRRVSELFTEALHAYRAQRWDEAERMFREVLGIWPDDTPSNVFIGRCAAFRLSPPGEAWDGVYEMKTK
jgi:adenylate cyclase